MFQADLIRKLLASSRRLTLHSPVLAGEEPVIAAWLGPHGMKTKQNTCMGSPQTPWFCSWPGFGAAEGVEAQTPLDR